MKILIADDDPVSCRILEARLRHWQYDVVSVRDGAAAWAVLEKPDRPQLAILDWMMPEIDGPELCRRVRGQAAPLAPTYIYLLTGRDRKADVVDGLAAGADDYITKPFDPNELHARLEVGSRLVRLQQTLADRVRELEEALRNVKQLQGLLPICAWCKKIRDDQNYWQRVEDYLTSRSAAQVTHGICPDCLKREMERGRRDLGKPEPP